jgi:hypothetical protein
MKWSRAICGSRRLLPSLVMPGRCRRQRMAWEGGERRMSSRRPPEPAFFSPRGANRLAAKKREDDKVSFSPHCCKIAHCPLPDLATVTGRPSSSVFRTCRCWHRGSVLQTRQVCIHSPHSKSKTGEQVHHSFNKCARLATSWLSHPSHVGAAQQTSLPRWNPCVHDFSLVQSNDRQISPLPLCADFP